MHQILAPLTTTTTGFEVQPSDAVQLGAPSHSFFLGRVQLSPIERKVHATPIYGHTRSTSKSLHQSSFGVELGMICQEIFQPLPSHICYRIERYILSTVSKLFKIMKEVFSLLFLSMTPHVKKTVLLVFQNSFCMLATSFMTLEGR